MEWSADTCLKALSPVRKSWLQKATRRVIPVIWNIWSREIYKDRKQVSGCQGLGRGVCGNGRWPLVCAVFLLQGQKRSRIDCGDGHINLWIYQKKMNLPFKWVNCVVCKLSLNYLFVCVFVCVSRGAESVSSSSRLIELLNQGSVHPRFTPSGTHTCCRATAGLPPVASFLRHIR